MNAPLCFLAVGAVAAGFACHHWMQEMVNASSAAVHSVGGHGAEGDHPSLLGMDIHKAVMIISIICALSGIALAAYFHLIRREAADKVKKNYAALCDLLENKFWIDELYDVAVVRPLKLMGSVFFLIDRLVIDGMVAIVGLLPSQMGKFVRQSQTGVLQGYGLGMVLGLAGILIMVTWMLSQTY